MPRLSVPSSISAAHVHAPRGVSYVVFALFAVAHAFVIQWMWQTVGVPFRDASEQNERIQATNSLHLGMEQRNLIQLQSGLTRAAELPTFNDTLFDDAKSLHRLLRKSLESLDNAEAAGQLAPLALALDAAMAPHTDGRPIVDRFHLRTSAKALRELEKKREQQQPAGGKKAAQQQQAPTESELAALYERVKAATSTAKGGAREDDADGAADATGAAEEPEEEKKLPSKYLPSFWACLAFVGCAFGLLLTHLCCHWSVAFRALMYYHSSSSVGVGSFVRVVPPAHRGAAEIVPIQRSSDGALFFLHQRQKYEVVPGDAVDEASGARVVGTCRACCAWSRSSSRRTPRRRP